MKKVYDQKICLGRTMQKPRIWSHVFNVHRLWRSNRTFQICFISENNFIQKTLSSFSQNVHPWRPILIHSDGRLSACERQGSQVPNEESFWRFKSNQSVWNFISFYSLVLCSYIRLSKLSTNKMSIPKFIKNRVYKMFSYYLRRRFD